MVNKLNRINLILIVRVIISILLSFALFYSCITEPRDQKDSPPRTTCYDTLTLSFNPLMPGKVDSYWKYKMFIYNRTKRYDSSWIYKDFSSFRFDFNDTSVIIYDSTKREIASNLIVHYGNYCYDVVAYTNRSLSYENPEKLYWLYWIGGAGIYEMGGYNDKDTLITKGLKIPYPIKRGDTWNGLDIYYDGLNFRREQTILRECVADNEKLVTPILVVDSCSVILSRQSPGEDVGGYDDYYQYYAPGKGLVCQVLKHTAPYEKNWFLVSVLVNYEYLIK